MMDLDVKSQFDRENWALNLENELLKGGASFSEWATLMSYEAHLCFVTGADIATIILCASSCETYVRTELSDFKSKYYKLIGAIDVDLPLQNSLHALRKSRNRWAHALVARDQDEVSCYSEVYTPELEDEAKTAYSTMLRLLFSNPWI